MNSFWYEVKFLKKKKRILREGGKLVRTETRESGQVMKVPECRDPGRSRELCLEKEGVDLQDGSLQLLSRRGPGGGQAWEAGLQESWWEKMRPELRETDLREEL